MSNIIQMSPVKWLGAKTSILNSVFRHIPKRGHVLVEPFCGSCAISLNSNYDNYVLNDLNLDLIDMYKFIVSDPLLFIEVTKAVFTLRSESDYYRLREEFNSLPNGSLRKSVLFLYLNRHGYRGLIRYNKSHGALNVPFGHYTKPYLPVKEILFFANKMKDAIFTSVSFEKLLSDYMSSGGDCRFYIDPPYLELSKTSSFVGYTSAGFSVEQHIELDRLVAQLRDAGSMSLVSNHDVPLIDTCYQNATRKVKLKVRRSISANAKKHNKAPEVILVYK